MKKNGDDYYVETCTYEYDEERIKIKVQFS